MAPPCEITFSRTRPAVVAIPEHGVEVGKSYWASDQELPDENGNPVRLIGHRFLQREDETPAGRPPRYAGNAYVLYEDCTSAPDGTITCQLGACIVGDCCYETIEGLCSGEFQGPNTACELPHCFDVGACCGAIHSIDCITTTRLTCPTGWFGAGRTCDKSPSYCLGACCIHSLDDGTLCQDGTTPSQCRDFQDFLPQTLWTVWLGPETTCDAEDCPNEGGCCRQPGWVCENTTPPDCVENDGPGTQPSVFMGLGNFCGPETCNGACCLDVVNNQPGGIPSPFIPECTDDLSFTDCEPGESLLGHFLGPGSTCENNAGDCGVCCLVDLNDRDRPIVCRTDMLQTECLEAGGTPFGPGSQCEICDTVRRACCIPKGGPFGQDDGDDILQPSRIPCEFIRWKCVDVRSQEECLLLHGFFHHDTDCTGGICRSIAGACCCPQGTCPNPPCGDFGFECVCYNTLEEDCPFGCVWHGPGMGCAVSPGDPIPFPVFPGACVVDCTQVGCTPGGP